VSALDSFGLPGERSEASRFTVAPDNTPPYLKIDAPGTDVIVRGAKVEVSGETEPNAVLKLADKPLAVDASGHFATTIEAASGDNTVTLVATDPAGNKTTLERKFVYMPDKQSVVAFDPSIRQSAPGHFLTNSNVVSLSGKTTADSTIAVRAGKDVLASAATGADGLFRINVPLAADEEKLAFAVIAPSGFTSVEDFAVTIDRVAPEVALDGILPRLTSTTALRVAGRTEPDAKLTLNGREVALVGGRFDETITLRPGDNPVELIAEDPVGNVTIEKSTVKLDQDPPQLLSSKATPATNGGKKVLALEVIAADASGLAKAAPFKVLAGAANFSGYLRYNKAAKAYQGFIVIPEADIAGAKLSAVELTDDAGNSKTFETR
jgi:hypothetical protein